MKKLLFLILLSSFSNCTKSQSWEKGICDCIESNYNLESWDYFKEMESFELEMIERGRITKSMDSKIELLNKLGDIEYVDFYKDQFSERFLTFGEESLFYCIRRELFNKNCEERHWSEKLTKALNRQKIKLQEEGDLKLYNKNRASTILKAIQNNKEDNRLKKIIILQELYRRIPDESWFNLDQTKLKSFEVEERRMIALNKPNSIEVFVNGDNEIFLQGNILPLEKLKDSINVIIIKTSSNLPEDPEQVIISLTCQKTTSYKKYLDVYNELKKTNAEIREEKPLEDSRNSYKNLGIRELIKQLQLDKELHKKIGSKLSEYEISEIEERLGQNLPNSYRIFLNEFGNGAYWLYHNPINDISKLYKLNSFGKWNKKEIESEDGSFHQIDSLLTLMSEDSNGGAWCWLTTTKTEDGEWPLAYYINNKLHYKVKNFTEWLRLLVKCKHEVIRELDKENKLGLG